MFYFIFGKNLDNILGSLYKIAENQSDLDNLNIDKSIYQIIEDTQINFENVKYSLKNAINYSGQTITYSDVNPISFNKNNLKNYIDSFKEVIQQFLKNNTNHPLYNRWNNYYNQLNSLNLDSITYPLNKSLEQYFNDLGQPSYNILQLP
jgi:hypothetical protein